MNNAKRWCLFIETYPETNCYSEHVTDDQKETCNKPIFLAKKLFQKKTFVTLNLISDSRCYDVEFADETEWL
jgi:hypothetical protein